MMKVMRKDWVATGLVCSLLWTLPQAGFAGEEKEGVNFGVGKSDSESVKRVALSEQLADYGDEHNDALALALAAQISCAPDDRFSAYRKR